MHSFIFHNFIYFTNYYFPLIIINVWYNSYQSFALRLKSLGKKWVSFHCVIEMRRFSNTLDCTYTLNYILNVSAMITRNWRVVEKDQNSTRSMDRPMAHAFRSDRNMNECVVTYNAVNYYDHCDKLFVTTIYADHAMVRLAYILYWIFSNNVL